MKLPNVKNNDYNGMFVFLNNKAWRIKYCMEEQESKELCWIIAERNCSGMIIERDFYPSDCDGYNENKYIFIKEKQ